MRRLLSAVAVLALCLSGCATDKSFEKEILGHQAPPSPTDTGWSRAPATPPPPPPPPPSAAPAPEPVPAGTAPVATPHGPAEEPAAPKLFTPAQASPAPAPVSPTKSATPVHGAQHGSLFTFQVGAFAHAQTANQLMATLQGKGYSVRVEQGTLNRKTFYKVFATKEGTRAALEGELFALGVSEPRLAAERPLGSAAPAGQKAAAPAAQPASATAAQPVPVVAKPAPAATAKPPVRYAPPVVEPAPPLPDGYVPPPPKNKE
ncbi:Sporulation domain protein [Solidesulfovibrio fructosivorans JJ]]|uniref:Sporulation domain protein n=1 Tax=Solidesulfovibrio fructosivorans JJ] TaxID=596151 RepID=E1JU47_SOLFR|nr:SPOR domain-containing protein [Solidesulfovibrio fructosivorans]EFL51977.1 Sporulation domain protein [Solidesulfovibrio fructosivorans JJ]]